MPPAEAGVAPVERPPPMERLLDCDVASLALGEVTFDLRRQRSRAALCSV